MLPWRTRLGAAAVTAGALAACPALQAQRWGRAEQTLVEVEGYRGVLTQDPGIRFTADVRDVESADSGAALVLSLVMRDGSTRRVQVQGGPGGRLERSYRVAGAPAPYDSSAARWLHLVLPRVAPRTLMFHRTRMGRVIREQGVDSLLAQLARTPQPRPGMPGYYDIVRDSSLTRSQFGRVLEGAVRGLPRANALGSFLGAAAQAPAALRDDTAFAGVIDLADSVPQQERVEVLGAISSVRGPHSPLLYTAWLRALNGLRFDDQRVRVLFGMVGGWMATSAYTADAIELVGGLESPADRARVLLAVPATRIPDPAVRASYERVLGAIPAGAGRDAAAAHLQRALSAVRSDAPAPGAAPPPGEIR